MAGMIDPTNRLHPMIQGVLDAGTYGPMPTAGMPLLTQVRNDPYSGPGSQRYMSPERKASGFYGELGTPRISVTEYSLGGPARIPEKQNPATQAFTYPSLVPGMTGKQIGQVVDAATGKSTQPLPPVTENMAYNSAQNRMSQGLSPFWNPQQDNLMQGMK